MPDPILCWRVMRGGRYHGTRPEVFAHPIVGSPCMSTVTSSTPEDPPRSAALGHLLGLRIREVKKIRPGQRCERAGHETSHAGRVDETEDECGDDPQIETERARQ